MLLDEIGAVVEGDVDFAGGDVFDRRAQQQHERLFGEAGADAVGGHGRLAVMGGRESRALSRATDSYGRSTGAAASFQARQPPAMEVTFV